MSLPDILFAIGQVILTGSTLPVLFSKKSKVPVSASLAMLFGLGLTTVATYLIGLTLSTVLLSVSWSVWLLILIFRRA